MSTAKVRVYEDVDARAVIVEGVAIGMRFYNELHAVGRGDGTVALVNSSRSTDEVEFLECEAIPFAEYGDESGLALAGTEAATVNALNSILRRTGTVEPEAPEITSPLTVNVTDGDPVNYVATAERGVTFYWLNLPLGLAPINGYERNVIGVIQGGAGSYAATLEALNYAGVDTETVTFVVSAPPFSNTKSVDFSNNDYLDATANTSNPLYRLNQNTATPWTISLWFKAGTATNSSQTILSFGGDDLNNEGRVLLQYRGNINAVRLEYGTNFNRLRLATASNTVPPGTWVHILVTYDGGTTENGSGGIADSYSRFRIYIDGVAQSTSNAQNNFGYSGIIKPEFFRVGERITSAQHMRNNCRVDELALWSSDEGANVADIYNSGTPFDLSTLASPPAHWWRMGDGDTYPTLFDNVGSLNFTMTNMTASEIVNDVP